MTWAPRLTGCLLQRNSLRIGAESLAESLLGESCEEAFNQLQC